LNQSEGEHADLQESLPADGFANKFSANEFPTDECNDELLESIQHPILPNYMEEPTDNVQSGHEDVPMPGPTDALPQNNPAGVPAGAVLRETYHASYVWVVHTTGIHNLGMISCQCRGQELLPVNLMASHLVPASFQIIRTLFTIQVLDGFRFSNLEMKASAYQFFNMLRRITSPLVPGNTVDLDNEFRRMTRLWRWLKKLKWAGYGHKVEDPADEEGGKMTIFCPACPQHNMNLPKDWHERCDQWMYQCVFVADGNFKADHVRPVRLSNNIWLIDGAGMAPKQEHYLAFLAEALERPTVRLKYFTIFDIPIPTYRKHHVNVASKLL